MHSMLSSLSPARRRMALVFAGIVTLAVLVAGVAIMRAHRSAASAHDTTGGTGATGATTGATATSPTATSPTMSRGNLATGAPNPQAGSATSTARNTPSAGATALTQAKPGPVLLVPGYGGSTGALTVLAAALRRHGRDAQVVDLPGDGTGDLRAQATALAKAVDNARSRTGKATVDLVGYSAGGVVARLYVRNDGGASTVRRVVTLGSPQHGTELAAQGVAIPSLCPLACQQLVPDSDLLTALNKGSETPRGPTFVSLWSDVDQTVVPPDSARLKGSLGMSLQSICSTSTTAHGNLPRDRLVTAIVLGELDGAATRQYSAKDCAGLS